MTLPAFAEGMAHTLKEQGLPDPAIRVELLRTRDALYGNLIQAGVDRIDMFVPTTDPNPPLPTSTMLRRHVKVTNRLPRRVAKAHAVIGALLQRYEHTGCFVDRGFFFVLPEIANAAHERKSLILGLDLPRLEHMILPPELEAPLRMLYKNILSRPADLPFASCTIDRDALRRYEDVLCSSLFADYESAGLELEASWIPPDKAIKSAQKAARALVCANEKVLALRPSRLMLVAPFLHIFAELFNGLPAQFAKLALSLMQNAKAEDQRLVIYRMFPKTQAGS